MTKKHGSTHRPDAKLQGWFAGRLPDGWFTGPADGDPRPRRDRRGRARSPSPTPAAADADDRGRAPAGPAIQGFREDTRAARACASPTRPRPASAARSRGAPAAATRRSCSPRLSVPVMTRLRMPERQVLDTLVDAGVARSRSHALAWCVRLVGDHEGEWIDELRDAARARAEGPRRGPGEPLQRRPQPVAGLIVSVLMIRPLWNLPLGRRLYLGAPRRRTTCSTRRLSEHAARASGTGCCSQGGDARRRRQPTRARASACASSRPRWCATSTSWPRRAWSSVGPIREDRRVVRVVVTAARATRDCRSCTQVVHEVDDELRGDPHRARRRSARARAAAHPRYFEQNERGVAAEAGER